MLVTLMLFLTCIILFIWKLRTDINYWQKAGFPFQKPLPFVGNFLEALLLQKHEGDLLKKLYFKSEEPFFGVWFLNRPMLIVKCPNLIKQILVRDFSYFPDRFVCDEEEDEFSSNMLFFMTNPKWKLFRTKTRVMFSACKMKNIYREIQSISKNMVTFINNNTNKRSINASDIFVKFTTQVAYSTGFGIDAKSFQIEDTPFVSFVRNAFTSNVITVISWITYYYKSFLSKIFKFKMVNASHINFLKDIFSKIEASRKSESAKRGDIMDFLMDLKNEKKLGDTEIVAQMAQFLVVGYDATNTIISLTLYELALNKHVQDKLRGEIYANVDMNGEVSYERLNIMEYLDKVMHETLRKYPVVTTVGRTCTKNYRIPNTASVIERGVEIIISLSGLHHDPKYYPEPDLFDPERFSKENIQKRHPYTYLPFGKGPRNCIGERMGLMLVKLGIVHVLKTFEVNICDETTVPLKFDPRKFTLSVVGGVHVQFVKLE